MTAGSRVQKTSTAVFLVGRPGAGKSRVARAGNHYQSQRSRNSAQMNPV